jgi:type I restriction enzyme M protein
VGQGDRETGSRGYRLTSMRARGSGDASPSIGSAVPERRHPKGELLQLLAGSCLLGCSRRFQVVKWRIDPRRGGPLNPRGSCGSRQLGESNTVNALGQHGVGVLAQHIEQLDPEGKYVKLDVANNIVEYSADIESGEHISSFEGEEEPCRAYIVAWLCTIGGYLPGNLALERRYSIGRPKTGAELDILVLRPDGTAFSLIEVKSPVEYDIDQDKYIEGQLFNIAPLEAGSSVLSYATVCLRGDNPEIVCKSIDYLNFPTFRQWADSRAFSTVLPSNYGEPVHVHLAKGGERDLNHDVSLSELRRIQRRLHDVLWRGSTPDNKIYDQVIRLFLAKAHDEKTTRRRQEYRFQIRYPANVRERPDQTFENVSELYKEAYRKYLNLPRDADVEGLNAAEFSFEQTAFVVELLQDISLVQAASNADVLGSFFEGITREGFKQTKGLFFTHGNVVAFIISVLDLGGLASQKIKSDSLAAEKLPYIIDPSCGSGTFLLASMSHITRHVVEKRSELAINDDTGSFLDQQFLTGHENAWAGTFLYGLDAAQTLAISTKVNMLLRQDGQAHVYHLDGLAPLSTYSEPKLRGRPHADPKLYSREVAETFDVVVSNPPFSITLDPQTGRYLQGSFELAASSNSENLFLERWYQLLKPHGRIGVVLPESFFSTKENLDARLFLFSHFNVKAVVSLPKEAFEPWTPTRTSLLFAEKKSVDEERAWIMPSVRYEARGVTARRVGLAAIKSIIRNAKILLGHAFREKAAEQWVGFGGERLGARMLPDEYALQELREIMTEWRDIFGSQAPTAIPRQASTFVRGALRRLDDIDEQAQKVGKAVRFFDIEPTTDNLVTAQWSDLEGRLAADLNALNRFDVRVWAFGMVAAKHNLSFSSAAVENVGYRRTKRGESERPNDLFVAEQVSETRKRVLDLDITTAPWTIRVEPSGADILSKLRSAVAWSEL